MNEKNQKVIGVLTSGGDAPGMNAAVRSVVRTAIKKNMAVMGIRRGYNGLINGDMSEMNIRSVSNVLHRGGTPTARDRIIASQMGYYAVELLEQGIGNRVIIQKDGKITDYDILEALTMQKGLDPYLLQVNDAINI